MSRSMFKRKRFWLGLGVTAVFLYLAFRKVAMAELATALWQANYWWLLPALVVYLGGYLLRAVRWQVLVEAIKPLAWTQLLPSLILGFMFNNILPARAGEFVRAYVLGKREQISKSSVFATVVMERVYDGLVMVLFAVLVLAFFQVAPMSHNEKFVRLVNSVIDITAVLFVFLFLLLFALITWKERCVPWLTRCFRWLPQGLRQPAERMLRSFIDGLAVLRSRRRSLLALGLSTLAWLGESAAYYFVLRAFGLNLPVVAAVMLMAIVNLGIMLPSSPGYIGPFEFFGVGTLLLYGIEKSASLPCILVIHSLIWLPITLWGFYYMWTLKLSFSEIEAAAPDDSAAKEI